MNLIEITNERIINADQIIDLDGSNPNFTIIHLHGGRTVQVPGHMLTVMQQIEEQIELAAEDSETMLDNVKADLT